MMTGTDHSGPRSPGFAKNPQSMGWSGNRRLANFRIRFQTQPWLRKRSTRRAEPCWEIKAR